MKNWVLFRFPNQTDIHFIGCNNATEIDNINIASVDNAFILRPFNTEHKALLISGEEILINPNQSYLDNLNFHFKNDIATSSTLENEYVEFVQKSIVEIKNNQFKKVVPARVKKISSNKTPESIIISFNNACSQYPNAFVSLSTTEKFGTWIGATPEKLISIDNKNILETVALAGTQLSNGKSPSEAVWTQKEIEEQALVSRFIINSFKEIRLREFEEIGPKTIKAGNLLHLKTNFSINLNSIDYKNLDSTLLKLLHPTSAVCGMPKINSMKFILENENFDRQIYAGFIGPINFNNETTIFVNLRTAQINKESINLYAGAGVTEDSNPEKEWVETENKIEIIKQSLCNN